MNFANPKFLWFIPAALLLGILVTALAKRQQKRLAQWIAPDLWKFVIPEYKKKIFTLKNITLTIAFLFLAIALSRPQWGEREEVIQSEGMDILFVLDISNSMSAEDVAPSRLKRAQSFIRKILPLLPNDRAGIIAFAGSAYLAAPLTTDFDYVSEIADSLEPNMITNQGTEIGQAIEVAIQAFERSGEDDHKTSRAIVLISDGEDFGKDPLAIAQKVADFGAGFFALSVGSAEGAPIPIRSESGVLQTYKTDHSGKQVLSRVNKDLLSKIAEIAGGKFSDLVNPDDSAYSVARQLRDFHRSAVKDQRIVTRIDRFQIFLAIAILFLFLHLFLGYRRVSWSRKVKLLTPPSLVLLFLFLPQQSSAQSLNTYLNNKKAEKQYKNGDFDGAAKSVEEARKDDPDNATLQFNEGTALAKAHKDEEALFHLAESSKKALSQGDYDTAAKALYNEGITHLENKNMKDGYDRLTKAIEMAKITGQSDLETKSRDALYNAIEKQKQQSKENQDKKNGGKGDEKGKNQSSSDEKNDDSKSNPGKKDSSGDQDKKKNSSQAGQEPRNFKSGTLSKDVAESIMNDLSDREKQLYQHRMKNGKRGEVNRDKDW